MVGLNSVANAVGRIIAGMLYDATGSYNSVYLLLLGMGAVSIVISLAISACDKAQLAKK